MFPLYLQEKYARQVLTQIERNKIINVSDFLACGRCPICGDSKKKLTKTRFYIYRVGDTLNVKCHNCDYSKSFSGFLKQYNPSLFDAMQLDAFKDNPSRYRKQRNESEINIEPKTKPSDDWKKCVINAHHTTAGKQFLESRKIPKQEWDRIYITDSVYDCYCNICSVLGLDQKENNYPDFPSIAIPFIRNDGVLTHMTFRNLDTKSSFRYITAEFNGGQKVFGLDKLDKDKRDVYVVEGPIDSLFLDNCIAMGDASLDRATEVVSKNRLVLIPDNEPRALVQIKRIKSFIDSGFRVCIFPANITEKDINDMVKSGYDVQKLVQENTFSGIMADYKYHQWKRI